jgi:hypothetical protein
MVASTQRAHPIAKSCSQPATAILLVEDDPAIAPTYRFRIEYDGHRVHHDDPGLIQRRLQLGAIHHLIKSHREPWRITARDLDQRQSRLRSHRDAFATGLQPAQGGFTCS